MATRIRKDAGKLATWDPLLEWYARAVREMQARPIADPTSWRYQAAIHDYIPGADPNAAPGEQLPSPSDQARFWRQCQHFCWFFLPWHRMYLLYFERIVAAAVEQLGGPSSWALPYWNYSDSGNPNARRIPAAFRERTLPDGSDNPLRVADRDAGNDGSEVGTPLDVDICTALENPRFAAQGPGGDPGFGGGKTGFNHSRGMGTVAGELERVPHGSMHSEVGGFMGMFHTAGLDPLFWLHHANIDRLWEVWRNRNPAHTDPSDARWRRGVTFALHDELGNVVTHTSSQVVGTTVPPLDYEYEDVSDPCAAPETRAVESVPVSERKPEMVGATDRPVHLSGRPAVARLALAAPTGPARAREAAGAPSQVYLNIENITGSGKPVSYSVYLNLPPDEPPDRHPELFAGILPMFGVAEASQPDETHEGGGLHYALDVSAVVRTLQGRADWDPNDLRVTFVPRARAVAERAREAEAPSIQVGRVSLYFA